MDTNTLIVGGLIALFIAAIIFLTVFSEDKEKAKKRVAGMGGATKRGRAGTKANADASGKERRKKLAETLEKIDQKNKETKKKPRLSLAQTIEQSGMEISVQQFYIASLVCAVVLGLIGVVSGQQPWVSGLMFFVGAVGLPRWFVNAARKAAAKKVRQRIFKRDRCHRAGREIGSAGE